MLQWALVACLLTLCVMHVLYRMLQATLRRRAAQTLLRWPLPRTLRARVDNLARAQAACACDGCDQRAATPEPTQVIRIVPRVRR